MAIDSLRQRGQDRLSIRRDPAFTLITGGTRRNHQVLHQEGLLTLEARSCLDRYLHHMVLDGDPRRHLARNRRFPFYRDWRAPGSVALSMPLGLLGSMLGRPF